MSESKKYEQQEELFTHIVEQLSVSSNISNILPDIIERTCRFFSFASGFVYETERLGLFLLKEHIETDKSIRLPENINLSDILNKEEITEFSSSFIYADFTAGNVENTAISSTICRYFNANTILIVPFVNKDNVLAGFTGILNMDAANNSAQNNLTVARAVLLVIANHVQLRISRRLLTNTHHSLSFILDNTGVDIYVNDFYTHEILYVNKSMAAPYGGAEALIGKKCYEALYSGQTHACEHCPQKKLIDEEGNPTKRFSWDYRRPFDGSWHRVFSSAFRWMDGRIAHVVSSVDITESKKYEFLVEQMAFYDTLTNIPNRKKFDKDYEQILLRQKNRVDIGHLLFLDLDDFKHINDVFSHEHGDELLQQVAYYLDAQLPANGKAYRYGEDKFLLLFCNVTESEINTIVKTISERFQSPWNLSDMKYDCTCSIGVSRYPQQGNDSDSLIHTAKSAMYQAKRSGKAHAEYYHLPMETN